LFDLPQAPPATSQLGAEALAWLHERPDLTLLRVRQLLEVLVRTQELEAGVHHVGRPPDFSERCWELVRRGLLDAKRTRELTRAYGETSEAVHMFRLQPKPPGVHAGTARRLVLLAAQAWAEALGAPVPERVVPPDTLPAQWRAAFEASALLDLAEEAVERRRDDVRAEELVGRAEALTDGAGLDQATRDRLDARAESVRLAVRNHRGEPPTPIDRERVHRLLAGADASGRDVAVHLLNRRAVASTNVLDLERARAEVEPLVEQRDRAGELRLASGWQARVRDYQLGALHGTLGMIEALSAHAYAEPDLLDEAQAHFDAATGYFTEDDDRDRHVTNTLHTLVERVRLGGELTAAQRARLEALVEESPVELLAGKASTDRPWHPASFRVAAAVKACAVLGLRVPWTGQLLQALSFISEDTRLVHPYPGLVGWTLLCVQAAPRRLRRSLELTAQHEDSEPLIRWISSSFLEPELPRAPGGSAQAWWDELDAGERSGPVWWLPFNFA